MTLCFLRLYVTERDAHGCVVSVLQRSKNQRLINEALSLTTLEELSSMVMPIQPPTGWEAERPWNKYLRDDVSQAGWTDAISEGFLLTHLPTPLGTGRHALVVLADSDPALTEREQRTQVSNLPTCVLCI